MICLYCIWLRHRIIPKIIFMPLEETTHIEVTEEEARLIDAFRKTKMEVDLEPKVMQKDLAKLMMQLHPLKKRWK